jgi:uncharacterized membrane protein (Fun14 family)
METIKEFIQQNSNISIGVAIFLILIAGFILRKLKTLAIILIIITSLIFYALLQKGSIDRSKIEKLKENTKEKIIERIKKQ